MAKFVVNKGQQSQKSIEAESYRLEQGYFNFYDTDKEIVFTHKADNVIHIRREDESK